MSTFNWRSADTENMENINPWIPFDPFQTHNNNQHKHRGSTFDNNSHQNNALQSIQNNQKHSNCNRRISCNKSNNFPEPQFKYKPNYKPGSFNICKPQIPSSPEPRRCLKAIKEDIMLPVAEEFKSMECEEFEELPFDKYTNHNVRPPNHKSNHHASKPLDLNQIPMNRAMSLWTIHELRAYLNRNDFRIPVKHRKCKWYYYRLAVLHQKLKQNRNLEQEVLSLSKSIETKDCEIRCIKSQTNEINQYENHSNNDMNEVQFKKLMELQQELRNLQQENQALRRENTSFSNTIDEQKQKIQQIQTVNNDMNEEIQRAQDETNHHKHQMTQLEEQCTWFKQRDRKHEEVRKKMHNKIQEFKGNIRVFCRIRPLFAKQEDAIFKIANEIETDSITLLAPCAKNSFAAKANKSKRYNFAFDRVFGPSANQETVFREISELVQSALDGYKVCIFAYGQTGSGKTFTMNGESLNPHDTNRGMIPRSMEQIFEYKQTLQQKGWQYKCTVSYLEIYNETIRDLLVGNKSNKGQFFSYQSYWGGNKNMNETKGLEIRQRRGSNEVYVDGLKEIEVASSSDVYSLLNVAAKNRSVARTECNERSSRSHTVFQLFLRGQNAVNGQKTFGVLNLIDLAGSERLKKSGATGMQLKETKNINKSLSCLGDVIAALASKKNGHIPYRNSKLTYFLTDYFGGEAKTLMMVNLCPEKDKTHESLCSLRFAAKVNACELGSAKRTVYK